MTFCLVLGAVLVALIGFACLPVRMDAQYDGDVFSMVGKVGPVPVHLLPKRKAQSRSKKRKLSPKKEISGLFLENGGQILYKAMAVMKIELLRVHFTAAGPDPYDAAMAYAQMGVMMEALEHFSAGRVENTDFRADVDFEGQRTVLDGRIRLRARMFHVINALFRFGTGFLRGYFRYSSAKTEG